MPRSTFTQLDPAIAGVVVDPEAEVEWFGMVTVADPIFSRAPWIRAPWDRALSTKRPRWKPTRIEFAPRPLPGTAELAQTLRSASVEGQPGAIDHAAVDGAIGDVEAACGPSRARGKARALGYGLHHSLAVAGILAPASALHVLGRALGLEADLARLETRTAKAEGHWVDTWLTADMGSGPLPEDLLALKIIVTAHRDGPTRAVRQTIWSLLHWWAAQGRSPSAVAINALGVVAGVIDGTGRVRPLAVRHILHRDGEAFRMLVAADGRARLLGKRKAPLVDLGMSAEDASHMRGGPNYTRAVDAEVRRLRAMPAAQLAAALYERRDRALTSSERHHAASETNDARTAVALDTMAADWKALSPEERVRRGNPNGKRLADWRATYWRKRREHSAS
jgi:hypothetical protein